VKYTLECGCEFEQLGTELKKEDSLPSIKLDYNNLRDCPKTWSIFKSGKTKGVFQLENKLGQEWSEKVKPDNIDDTAALISLMRPGCLHGLLNGKSLAQHYVDRKNKEDKISYIHPSLESVLESTFGVLEFQEQSILIVKKIAGFTEEESESLRKSLGKKDSVLMAEIKLKFIEGCKKTGIVNDEIANQIFDWIEEGQKYLFNACLDPATVTETKNGYKTLEELKIGDFVNSPDGFIEVIDIIDQGDQEVYEIELENRNQINCTLNHKFMCSDGKIRPLYEIIGQGFEICHKKVSTDSSKVKNVTKIGTMRCMDITVNSDNHIFYANGIATSNSHAVAYSTISYQTAYVKAHFPLHFFTASLYYANEKQDEKYEIKHLSSDIKRLGINLETPNLKSLRLGNFGEFGMSGKNSIHFGIHNIKGIGLNNTKKFIATIEEAERISNKSISELTWLETIILVLDSVSKTIATNLINVGFFGKDRRKKLFEYSILSSLVEREKKWMRENIHKYSSFSKGLKLLNEVPRKEGGPSNKKRLLTIKDLISSLNKPSYELRDMPSEIASNEKQLLGVNLTTTILDDCTNYQGNMTVKEFLEGKGENVRILLEITNRNEYTIKNGPNKGKPMAVLVGEDETGEIDNLFCFSDSWENNKESLYIGAAVMIIGKKSDKGGIIIEKAKVV